jgi:pimeloyl-ACP methyl ester carboxylesterase
MGGYIALAFAELYPERLKALGLFHSTAMADSEEKKQVRQKGIAFTRENGAGKFLAQVIPNLYGEAFKTVHPDTLASHIAQAQSFSNEAIIGYYRAMMARKDRQFVLQKFAKPVLFIMGEEDKTVHLQETLPQSHLPRESHVHIWQQVAHMGMRENPSQANAALLGFLSHVNEN